LEREIGIRPALIAPKREEKTGKVIHFQNAVRKNSFLQKTGANAAIIEGGLTERKRQCNGAHRQKRPNQLRSRTFLKVNQKRGGETWIGSKLLD